MPKTIPHRYRDKVSGTVEIITQDVNTTLAQLMQHGASLWVCRYARALEDLFLQLTGKELRA